jgi:hypothetical protein
MLCQDLGGVVSNSRTLRKARKRDYTPIPMTVPNSVFLSSSALTATGHKRMRAKTVKRTRDIEPRMFRLCLLVGRRAERGIMVKREREYVGNQHERMGGGFISDGAK